MASAHEQIADALRLEILSGQWKAGERIPGEHSLASKFKVSRNTIRRALATLENSNVIDRRQGKGTFVAQKGVSHVLGDLRSYTDIILELGMKPGIQDVLVTSQLEAPQEAQDFLPGMHLWLVERVRTADGRPFCLMESWLPDAVGSAIVAEVLHETQSLYQAMTEQGYRPAQATEVIRAEGASEKDAAALHVPLGSPLLTIYRWTTDSRGNPIEYVRSTSPGSLYEYVIKLQQ